LQCSSALSVVNGVLHTGVGARCGVSLVHTVRASSAGLEAAKYGETERGRVAVASSAGNVSGCSVAILRDCKRFCSSLRARAAMHSPTCCCSCSKRRWVASSNVSTRARLFLGRWSSASRAAVSSLQKVDSGRLSHVPDSLAIAVARATLMLWPCSTSCDPS